ncbi:hypothetical protein BDV23DRAFT_176986 [Aspergillus alliaceus]|uniref:DUF7703 domain-containing protein n=1 Tax=Petromyces alliaceus TaxID=209559 RepID=A0A5N7BSN2_PETAA|nr:hypothetical protein BDV23DRAFT_176986 [Aspergillus alliaceus]
MKWLDNNLHSIIRMLNAIYLALIGVALYNAVELVVLCLMTFKHYRGCYFWSLLITSLSIIPHCLGYIFFLFLLKISRYVSMTFIVATWYCMVTGHSFVLWSRLHLIVQSKRLLSIIFWVICLDAILFYIPTTVLIYGSLTPDAHRFSAGYKAMERIQLIGFCVQESLLSIIYIWESVKILRLRPKRSHTNILVQLSIINTIILFLDMANAIFQLLTYSIKLKLEYFVLGQLIQIRRRKFTGGLSGWDANANLSCALGLWAGKT